jgi:hypothetical protein
VRRMPPAVQLQQLHDDKQTIDGCSQATTLIAQLLTVPNSLITQGSNGLIALAGPLLNCHSLTVFVFVTQVFVFGVGCSLIIFSTCVHF